MFCIIIRKKITFSFPKHHFKSEKYMNRLLSLNNWDNPPIAPPLLWNYSLINNNKGIVMKKKIQGLAEVWALLRNKEEENGLGHLSLTERDVLENIIYSLGNNKELMN